MDTITHVRERLALLRWRDFREISRVTGIPVHTIRNVAIGKTRNPRHNTIEPLREYLERQQ